ncbi:MAG TPA: kynurenine 3-monooxygenase [Bacteroidetes bacterium]|nr:kynurenine 3-monooxygenase [Bacteroidota bacterium]HRK04414.1 NAD(P)/FAD-dependent oxidoreductase [Chlorobiota bacterium]
MAQITIAGAGLVGCLLGVVLARRGHRVTIFERRPDMRSANISAGRSINLALSDRGLQALSIAGLAEELRAIAIPMSGRIMHDTSGSTHYQPYGREGQAINSVSRGELNKTLLTAAEQAGVEIVFSARCTDVHPATATATFELENGDSRTVEADILFGADGAYSAVRERLMKTDRFDYSQSYLEHGYKELHIPPSADGGFLLDKHALHIWPRKSYMMIALPNIDGSFTCTLFFAHNGSPSFAELRSDADVQSFFDQQFPDAAALMPTLLEDFRTNPESSLVTIRCSPWTFAGRTALIGDAAHAIVPFYGQGMNCGFEDVRVLVDCLDVTGEDWPTALSLYERYRKPAGNAIADLAVENFKEMRDKVADERFLKRKSIEAWVYQNYPDRFVPLYTLVTFSPDVPYDEAQRIGREQDVIMEDLLDHPDVRADWTTDAAQSVIRKRIESLPTLNIRPLSPKNNLV